MTLYSLAECQLIGVKNVESPSAVSFPDIGMGLLECETLIDTPELFGNLSLFCLRP